MLNSLKYSDFDVLDSNSLTGALLVYLERQSFVEHQSLGEGSGLNEASEALISFRYLTGNLTAFSSQPPSRRRTSESFGNSNDLYSSMNSSCSTNSTMLAATDANYATVHKIQSKDTGSKLSS